MKKLSPIVWRLVSDDISSGKVVAMVADVAGKLQTKSVEERSHHSHKLCGTGALESTFNHIY